MAIPTARVKIEILKLSGLDPAALSGKDSRYARGYVQAGTAPQLMTGRSRPIPNSGGDFSLASEAVPWVIEVQVEPGTSIDVRVEVCEDYGDQAPPSPVTISGSVADPWISDTITLGSGPAMDVKVTTTRINPTDSAYIARASTKAAISGTLTVPQGYVVQILEIAGLHKPDPAATIPHQLSTQVPGYLSQDDQGRIFVNRKPDGSWQKDTQYIEVKAQITAFGGPVIPGGAQVEWTVIDEDDPSNDASDFHREWGRYVDANDYDGSGKPIGAHRDDNPLAVKAGNTSSTPLFGAAVSAPTARWEQATGGPGISPISRTKAKSSLVSVNPSTSTSAIRIHCPNVLGTNLRLKAELIGIPARFPIHNAITGVMTLWSRIDVEVVRMAGAHSMSGALASIPPFFYPVCVQLDFAPERVVTGALDKAEMAPDENSVETASAAWVNNPAVFSHSGQGGWFFLGAARFPNPLPTHIGKPVPDYEGTNYTLGRSGNDVWVEVPAGIPNADFVRFEWIDDGQPLEVSFSAQTASSSATKTRVTLYGNDVQPLFTGHDADGSINHAYAKQFLYYPQHRWTPNSGGLIPGGFGVPSSGATVKVYKPGAVYTAGISPSVPDAKTGTGEFFAGRTIAFTHTKAYSTGTPPVPVPNFDTEILAVAVHEFLHAFGMPHKCGYWDWRTPREKSCCMNYFNTWLINESFLPIPGTLGKQGDDMCGRHLMEVRRVHLERNKGLNW